MSHSDVIDQFQGNEANKDKKLYTWTKFYVRRWLLSDFRSNLFFFSDDSLWVIVTSWTNQSVGRWKTIKNWTRGLNFISVGGPHVILARLRKTRDILTTPTQKINVKIEFPVVCLVVVHYLGVLINQFKPFGNAYAN